MLIMLNCRNFPHAERYGRYDAFFYLDRKKHIKEANMLYENAICCVVSYVDINGKSGDVELSFWQYRGKLEDDECNSWYMVGIPIGKTRMSKEDLARHPEFVGVIASDGDFNQFSIRKSL